MWNLHYHYDQLTDNERSAVDEAMSTVMRFVRSKHIALDGADSAERAADAIARWIIESRKDQPWRR